MFDLNSLQLSDTQTFQLISPDGEALYNDEEMTQPVHLEIYGRSSKQFKNWQASAARKQAAANGVGKPKALTPEQVAENTADFLTALTKSAQNLYIGGVEINSPEQFKEMYLNPKLEWVGDQVSEHFGDRASFLQK